MIRFPAQSLVSVAALLVAAALVSCPAPADAGVGKRISTNAQSTIEETIVPGDNVVLTVPLPSGYKSKKNYLKVTTTYHTSCFYGSISSRVEVDGNVLAGAAYMTEQVEGGYAEEPVIVTKSYFLDPESEGGPAITPGSAVTLTFYGEVPSTTLCYIHGATIIAEATK